MGDKGASSGKSSGGGARNYQEVDEKSLDKSVDKWESKLSEAEINIISEYTGPYAYELNDRLRNDNLDTNTINNAQLLDSALSKFDLDRDIITYRGVSSEALEANFGFAPSASYINKNLVGTVIKDRGFGSTSIDKTVMQDLDNINYVFKINVPKGKGRGAYIERMTQMPEEREFLLRSGYKLKITGATKSNLASPTVITADLVI